MQKLIRRWRVQYAPYKFAVNRQMAWLRCARQCSSVRRTEDSVWERRFWESWQLAYAVWPEVGCMGVSFRPCDYRNCRLNSSVPYCEYCRSS